MQGGPDPEDAVRAFIAGRREAVLRRAITDLATAPEEDLDRLIHRLLGTLGSYRLDEARDAVAALSAGGMDRASTVERLERLARAVAPREQS